MLHLVMSMLAQADKPVTPGVLYTAVVSVTAALVTALGLLWRDTKAKDKVIADLQDARVKDAQGVTAQLLKLNADCLSSTKDAASAIEANKEAVTEQKDALRALGNEIQMLRAALPPRRT